jgi:hypothetical protein
MKRRLLGFALLAHGFAHSAIPMWVGDTWTPALQLIWSVTIVGFVAAAFGVWRVPPLERRWPSLAMFSVASSALLLTLVTTRTAGLLVSIGLALNVALFVVIRRASDGALAAETRGVASTRVWHRLRRRVGWSLAGLVVVYVAITAFARPLVVRWGSTADERGRTLFGDELVPRPHYRIDHAITIHAPADSVWPWLAQLGQTRGGFYSLSWLERAFGVDIRNADVIRPEWQTLRAGDSVFATQPGYLGLGRLGWRVSAVDPGRAFILDRWGAFILVPVDSTTTRFVVRTRGEGGVSTASLVFGVVNVFVFEPAHFIMQRAMMQGVRARAEARMVAG